MNTKFKTLHQAIMYVLKDGKAKSFEEISQAIADQNLWRRKKDGNFPVAFQIRLRTVANKHYRNLFKVSNDGKIKLKKIGMT